MNQKKTGHEDPDSSAVIHSFIHIEVICTFKCSTSQYVFARILSMDKNEEKEVHKKNINLRFPDPKSQKQKVLLVFIICNTY